MTSFLFGAIHGDPIQGTYALAMGVVLHFIYLASRSLMVPMLLHFSNNALAVALVRAEPLKDLDSGDVPAPWHLYAAAGLLLVACLAAFWTSRTRLVGPWRPEDPGVACPPPGSGTELVTPTPWWPFVALVVAGLACVAGSLAMALR
jgi:CAAX protease family protein